MPTIKLEGIPIQTEDLDFPASVTPTAEQVAAKVSVLVRERNEWREKAEEAQKRERSYREREDKLREMECELFLQDAVSAFKIDKAEVGFLKEMWKENPTAVQNHVNGLRRKAYLKAEQGLSGSEGPPSDPVARVKALALEKMTNDKSLKEGAAMLAVLKENPELSAQYRDATVLGATGGEG